MSASARPPAFERLPDAVGQPVPVTIDGEPFVARSTDTVAAALLAAGRIAFRTSSSGEPRGPFCMTGACFDCRVTIDGNAAQRACVAIVTPGMRIETQAGGAHAAGGSR